MSEKEPGADELVTPESPATLGTPDKPMTLTDPLMMRALAHPARIAIVTHLGLHGPATATECAEVAGLSPSACSYHLRALARYGVVEEAADSAADGRQRPWQARILYFNIPNVSDDPAAELAGTMLAETWHADGEQTRARFLNRRSEYPSEWQEAVGDHSDVAHVTPAELDEMHERINAIISEYRRIDPDERTPGALPVRLNIGRYPWFRPEEAQ